MNNSLGGAVIWIVNFINFYLVPLIFALAFILFLWGVFRFFFAGANDEKRKEGRVFILWGIIAMAIMIAVWGLVNLLLNTFGLNASSRPCLPSITGPANCSGLPSGSLSEPMIPGTGLPGVF